MEFKCEQAAMVIIGRVELPGTESFASVSDVGNETQEIMNEEFGTEALIATISQRLEMNVIKYGSQFNAIRNGLYDLLEYKGTLNSIKRVNALQRNVDKLLGDVYLADLGTEVIPTIDGLSSNMEVFTSELYSLFRETQAYGVEIIDRVDNILSNFIGREDVRDSFIQLEHDLEPALKFNTDVASLVERNFSNSGSETATLKSLFGNNAEYKATIDNLVKINQIFTNKDLAKIEKKVEDIEARFTILLTVLKDNEEMKSRPSIDLLVKALSTLSTFLTNLSATYYFNVRSLDVVLNTKLLIK